MTTNMFQLRGMIASDVRRSMLQDPVNAGLPIKDLRAKIDAAVKEAIKGLPSPPHGYLRKVRARIRAERRQRSRELQVNTRSNSQRRRRRLIAERLGWHLKND